MIDASKALSESVSASVQPRKPAPPPASPNVPVRLYLDGSRSMAGFVGCQTASTEFDVTLDRLASDLGVARVTLFGETPRGPLFEERPIDPSVHCPAAFIRTNNPDYELYRAIANDSGAAVHVYLTDGVQSALSAATPSPSVAELQRWIQGGRGLAILAFRSRFSGALWSESMKRFIGEASTPERPFYAFILAPSDAQVEQVIDRISPALLGRATELRFSGAPLDCRLARAVSPFTTETTSPLWVMVPPPRGQPPAAAPVAEMSCAIPANSPLAEISARATLAYRPWKGDRFGDPAQPEAGTRVAAGSPKAAQGESVVKITGIFPPDPATRFGFYQVRLTPVPGRLKPVVAQLSTDLDGDPSEAARSYRFGWLVEHLVRARFSSTVPERSFFLTIQYR